MGFRHLRAALLFLALASCGGSRLPVSSARPTGTQWYCGEGSWTACGRAPDDCATENKRIGSPVVDPGPLPRPKECKKQELAVCYTFHDPSAGRVIGDCFPDRRTCELMRKEAERAPAAHRDMSDCGTWD